MVDDSRSTIAQHATRRRVLAGTAAIATTGAALTLTGGEHGSSARAATVSTDGLEVADAEYAAPDGQLYSPHISVEASWAFEGCDDADAVFLGLLVDGGLVDSHTYSISGPSLSATNRVEGLVADSRMWDAEEWTPPAEHTVTVRVAFEVRDASGATVTSDDATDDVTIQVTDAGPTRVASVSGNGAVEFVPEAGDNPVPGNTTE